MQHIRLIHKFLSPKNIWPISADRPNIWIFRFFSKNFFSKFLWYSLFFGKSFFLNKILDTQNVSKIMKIFLENNITSKSCLIKKFWVCTQKARKIQFFRFFVFCNFGLFSLKKCAFSRIIFFTFFHFSKKKF